MSDTLKLALVQTGLLWEDPEANRAHFNTMLSEISDVDIIVLPEMFSTGFTMSPGNISPTQEAESLQWMRDKAIETGSAITGSIVAGKQDAFYNRLFFITPEGDNYSYDKRHTFTLAGEDKVYRRGKDRLVLFYKGFQICPMICYDLRFPVWSRNTVDFDVLIYVANWPTPRVNAWDTLLKARAIENMVYSVGLNRIGTDANGLSYPGHSAVYDSLGEQIAFSDKEGILYAQLNREHLKETREKLKFLQDRDDFTLQL